MPAHVSPAFDPPVTADWLDGLQAFGWRGAVFVLVILLIAYALSVLLRLRRLGQTRGEAAVSLPPVVTPAAPTLETSDEAVAEVPALVPAYAPTPSRFAELARLEAVEREQIALRDEIIGLRKALSALREESERKISEALFQARGGQHVSPLYGDAMQMALAGHDAATVAERCGISRGEADLVIALVHRGEAGDDYNPGESDDDGGQSRH